jgi:hypothetical protein
METITSHLFSLFLGQPVWMWLAFAGLVVALLAFDLGILHRDNREIGVRESLTLSAFYIALGSASAPSYGCSSALKPASSTSRALSSRKASRWTTSSSSR